MTRRKGITAHLPPEEAAQIYDYESDQVVSLPEPAVMEAGMRKFSELARIGWPKAGKDEFSAFDYHNKEHLSIVLGLTYLEMRSLDKRSLDKAK